MKLYKITDENDRTRGSCQWGENITVETSGEGEMCGKGFTHWYRHPLLAVLFNPIHGKYNPKTMHLWEGKGIVIKDDGLKVGCKEAITINRVAIPKITTEQRVEFAIRCALSIYKNNEFEKWATAWLNGKDRSASAAWAAASATWAAASAAWAEKQSKMFLKIIKDILRKARAK